MNGEHHNFILGAGESLVESVPPPRKEIPKRSPYPPSEARARLVPRLMQAVAEFRTVPRSALPGNEAVAKLVLHPQYLSKSAFPVNLLRGAGLRAIGSKPTTVTPEKVARKSEPKEESSTLVYVAGDVGAFESLAARLQSTEGLSAATAEELPSVEAIEAMKPADRLRVPPDTPENRLMECVLLAQESQEDERIIQAFCAYASSLHFAVDLPDTLFTSGLCYLTVRGNWEGVNQLAFFSFLRLVRPMPRLRPFLPTRVRRSPLSGVVSLPDMEPAADDLVAAVFDTPLPAEHSLGRWVDTVDYGVPSFDGPDEALHGLCVTSAALLGPLDGLHGESPPFRVHHHGVLGHDPDGSGHHEALRVIQREVKDKEYPLINISFGPEEAISDDYVDPFTTIIEEIGSTGKTLPFVAVGNHGDLDDALQLNRIQPPSDAINAVAVGSATSRRRGWQKADYSCVGPGRLCGRIKPDLMAFGGCEDEPFGCVGPGTAPSRYDTMGTSFASPSAMRTAGMVFAALADQINAVSLKALLVHGSRCDDGDPRQVGHGILPVGLAELLTSEGDAAKILFQGQLTAGRFVRHLIPTPAEFRGMVELTATLCFATPTDAKFPASYSRSGIHPTFRPNSNNTSGDRPAPQPLFSQVRVFGASESRKDAHLWDTALKAHRVMRPATLQDPSIELHYNHRVEGQVAPGDSQAHQTIPYALVLTVRARQMPDLYDQIRSRFAAHLQVLVPRFEIPLRV